MPVVEAISVIVHCSAVSRNWGAPLNFWKPSLWGLYAWNLSVEVDSSFQKLRGAPQFLKTSSLRTNAWNFGPFWQGKTPPKPVKKVLWPHDIYKKYLLQKKWVKTAIPALSSGQSNLHQPIWGCHRQLDDQHRNPNNNDRDHLVGQLTMCYYAWCLLVHCYLLCFLRPALLHSRPNRQRHHYCNLLLSHPSPPPHHLLCFLLGCGGTYTPSAHGEDDWSVPCSWELL